MQRVSKRMLLIPGGHIEGEGVLLEIHGFIVEIVSPAAPLAGQPLEVRAKVTMTCGCPIEPGGLWNADMLNVRARAIRKGKIAEEMILRYAGESSMFTGTMASLQPGRYELEVLAADAQASNFGKGVKRITLKGPRR